MIKKNAKETWTYSVCKAIHHFVHSVSNNHLTPAFLENLAFFLPGTLLITLPTLAPLALTTTF